MPDFIHKKGNGSLFKNDYKEKETQPDMKGKATLKNGEKVDVAGWWKEGATGTKYLSISISEEYVKEDKDRVEKEGLQEKTTADDVNDGLPF